MRVSVPGGGAASGAGRGGPRSPERGFPLGSPALRGLDAQASASQHVRPQSARGLRRDTVSTPLPRTSRTGAALRARPRTRAQPRSGSRPREPSSQSRLDLEARKLVPGTGHLCYGSGRAEVPIGTGGRVAQRLHARVRPELPPPSAPLGRWTLLSGGFPGLRRLAPTCSPWAVPASRWMGRSGGTGRGQTAGAWCERPRGGTHPGWFPTVSKQGSQQAFLLQIQKFLCLRCVF